MTWIRANLNVTVSVELWDRFLDVVSSLTHWSEVVSEWKVNIKLYAFKPWGLCRNFANTNIRYEYLVKSRHYHILKHLVHLFRTRWIS